MTDTYQQIIDVLSRCKRVLVTTHVRPDGDAIGTTAALVLAMRKVNIESEVLLLTHVPTKYSFVYREPGIVHTDVENGWPDEGQGARGKGQATDSDLAARPSPLAPFFQRFDALLVADTGTWSQLPGLKERIKDWRVPKIVLDHHLTQEDWADIKLVVTEAAAAAEVAAELIEQWEIPIDSAIATALYVAIASDTGWFQFSNTRPFTHRLAATLIEKGVDTDRVYQMLYQNERPERVALQTRAMQSLELLANERVAVMRISKDDFARTRARVPDTENLINVPLQIRTVEVSILVTEPPEGGPIRVSLRSKGQVDVARFAEQFGGGGHARASGLKLETTFQEAHDRVVEAMLKRL
jgi:bifunctional oligoribonuclease and PAP phosphatase NrnA